MKDVILEWMYVHSRASWWACGRISLRVSWVWISSCLNYTTPCSPPGIVSSSGPTRWDALRPLSLLSHTECFNSEEVTIFCLHINKQVFKNPYEVVTVLLIQTLGAMVPSIPVCLNTTMERAAQDQRLDTLLELHSITSTFGHSLEAAMLPHLGLCMDKNSSNRFCLN